MSVESALADLIQFLTATPVDGHWLRELVRVQQAIATADTREAALAELRSWFGGMGSLNDVFYSPLNKNVPPGADSDRLNVELERRLDALYRELDLVSRCRWHQRLVRSLDRWQSKPIAPRVLGAFGPLPRTVSGGRDFATFRTTIPPEPTHGAVGWAVADALSDRFRAVGIAIGDARPWHDGVTLPCQSGRTRFVLEITPDFAAEPMRWLIEVQPTGPRRFVAPLWRPDRERLCRALDQIFADDARFTVAEWTSVRALTALRDRRRRSRRHPARRHTD